MANVAFLGLGVMGFPMAGWLAKKGHSVTVYNRTRAKSDKWREQHGGAVAATPADAAKGAEIVFSCVGDDPDLRAIALGDGGALAAMKRGAITSTTRPPRPTSRARSRLRVARAASRASTRRSREARPAPRTASSR